MHTKRKNIKTQSIKTKKLEPDMVQISFLLDEEF